MDTAEPLATSAIGQISWNYDRGTAKNIYKGETCPSGFILGSNLTNSPAHLSFPEVPSSSPTQLSCLHKPLPRARHSVRSAKFKDGMTWTPAYTIVNNKMVVSV